MKGFFLFSTFSTAKGAEDKYVSKIYVVIAAMKNTFNNYKDVFIWEF